MNLSVSGRRLRVTPAIQRYVHDKLGRVRRHFRHVMDVHVVLSSEKLRRKAEVTLHVRGKDLHCECEDPDLHAAIDRLADKLDRLVLKYKGMRPRRVARHRVAVRRRRRAAGL